MSRVFKLVSATQLSMARVRVTFSLFPLSADTQGTHDALNRTLYALTGPGVVTVAFVNRVPGDPSSVDLWLTGQLSPGTWTLSAPSIRTTFGETLVVTSLTFVAVAMQVPALTDGAKDDEAEDILRRHLNPALTGRGWDALVGAIALADQHNWTNAQLAFDQLFLCSASDKYLARKAGDNGVQKPPGLGMADDLFRRLAILVTSDKLTQEVLLELLEIFYGEDALHAWASTKLTAPFALTDLDDISFLIDEKTSANVIFHAADFSSIGRATAVETAAALTRSFQLNNVRAYALAWTDTAGNDYVKVYSSSRGLGSGIRCLGGRAQNTLQFPDRVMAYDSMVGSLPIWNITVLPDQGRVRFTTTGTSGLDLSLIQIGDYVTVYGTEFAAGNRGTFTVLDVYQAYPSGVLTQYFEVANLAGSAQAGLAQVADADLLYFRPTRQNTRQSGVTVEQVGGRSKIGLPATSRAVTRGYLSAAYFATPRSLTVSSVSRSEGGLVTVSAPSHGLVAGQQIEVLGGSGSTARPSVIAGDVVGPPLKTSASLGSVWSVLKAAQARRDHAAILLTDGRVLLTGGYDGAAQLSNCELFTITAQTSLAGGELQYQYTWTTDTALPVAHSRHRAIRIAELTAYGKVLVSGGWDGAASLQTAYLYAPVNSSTGTWSSAANMATARYYHGCCLRSGGQPFVCGGFTAATTITATTEWYDPTADAWTTLNPMNKARGRHTATTLQNGSVLACGGSTGSGVPMALAEVWNPGTGLWSAVGPMSWARFDHAALLLPNGRVLVVGGMGYIPSYGGTAAAILDCEIFDPAQNIWHPAGRLRIARSCPTVAYLAASNTVLVAGGGSAITEKLDLDTMRWSRSLADVGAVRDRAEGTVLTNGAVLMSGGINDSAVVQGISYLFLPGSERIFSGGFNGLFRVVAVPDANTIQYRTPGRPDLTVIQGAVVNVVAAPSTTALGAHLFDPHNGPSVTKHETTTTQAIAANHRYDHLDVADATALPDAPGWLVFSFGTARQTFPVRYLGRLSSTRLKLDFKFAFPFSIPSGSPVCLLKSQGAWIPASPQQTGACYITASNAGVAAASKAVDSVLPAGIPADKTIVYPGDRGLGGEGRPVTGTKIADKVAVWGSDDVDGDVAAARAS